MAKSDAGQELNTKEKSTVDFIRNHLLAGAKHWKFWYSGDKHKKWMQDVKWYKGMQWGKRSGEKSSIAINRIFSTIQRELPFMTDRRPIIKAMPQEPSDQTWSDIFNRILETLWVARNMEMKLPESVMHSKQCGTGFLMPFWNNELQGGLGDCDCLVMDPIEAFPLAYTKQFTPGAGFIWARWVSLGEIKKNYTDGWRVKGATSKDTDDSFVPDRAKETQGSGAEGAYAQVTDTTGERTDYLPTSSGSSLDESDLKRALLITLWVKDSTLEDVNENDTKVKKASYPNGRQITICGQILLEDIPFPFKTFPPPIPMPNYINPGEYWGMSDITQIKEQQKELNKINAMIIDAIKRDVYRQKYLNVQSGIEVETFAVTSDSIYETKIPNPVTETGQFNLPPAVFQFPDQIEKQIDATAGTQEYNTPQSGNLPSGKALQVYQEITSTRLRQKLRNMEAAIRQLGSAWVEMIMKNYTEERIMRLFNAKNDETEYVYIFKEEDEAKAAVIKAQAKAATIPDTEFKDPATGQPVPGTAKPKYKYILNMAEVKGDIDIQVVTSSTISVSRVASFEQALALFDRALLDQQAVLEAADYPGRDEIIERMNKEKEKQQEAMQAAAVQPGGLPGAPNMPKAVQANSAQKAITGMTKQSQGKVM